MEKHVADELLGRLAIEQAKLFRQVEEGSNDPKLMIRGLQRLIEQKTFIIDQKPIQLSVDNVYAEWHELLGMLRSSKVVVTEPAFDMVSSAWEPDFILRSPEVIELTSVSSEGPEFSSILIGYNQIDSPRHGLGDIELDIDIALKAVFMLATNKVSLFGQGIGALIFVHSKYAEQFLILSECCGSYTLSLTEHPHLPGPFYHCLVKSSYCLRQKE